MAAGWTLGVFPLHPPETLPLERFALTRAAGNPVDEAGQSAAPTAPRSRSPGLAKACLENHNRAALRQWPPLAPGQLDGELGELPRCLVE